MSIVEGFHQLTNEASGWTARVQTLVAKMNTAHEPTPDDYGAALLSTSLEIAIDHLRTAHEMASYLSRPIRETSRPWKNGSGQYETTAGFCFRAGSPIVSAPVRFCNFSPNRYCQKMAGNHVQPLNNYTCRFRLSSPRQADKSGLDRLHVGK